MRDRSEPQIDFGQPERPWPSRDEVRELYANWDREMRLAASRMPRVIPIDGESVVDVARRSPPRAILEGGQSGEAAPTRGTGF